MGSASLCRGEVIGECLSTDLFTIYEVPPIPSPSNCHAEEKAKGIRVGKKRLHIERGKERRWGKVNASWG